ncbi:hypothetical protein E1B28_001705 [Marasmius oreades]|uniref:DDE-1 domain-containing protein n=1 Tax=Marasmius oreades TaxID=181124 RepID=A0A9P7V3W8_9AGAR|nr:uncharacterized protein E1B28_001705 [Marasmius oreades]KAG7099906.1 hypothetical protein E1B28_001705 [Marasmius oreades]
MAATTKKQATGPPQHLIERIEHLSSLMHNLPDNLPLNPPHTDSSYHFSLDRDEFEERGVLGAVSRTLEVCFGQNRDGVIEFKEKGMRLTRDLPKMLKEAVKEMSVFDREVFAEAWIERLIHDAKRVGATAKKRKAEEPASQSYKKARPSSIIQLDSDDSPTEMSDSEPPLQVSIAPHPKPKLPTKQTTLPFAKDTRTEEEKQEECLRNMRLASQRMKDWKEKERRKQQTKVERERELGRLRQQKHRAQKKKEKEDDREPAKSNMNSVLAKGAAAEAAGSSLNPADIPELSRAGYEGWRKERNGFKNGAVQKRARRTNWFHPFLWVHIEKAMIKADWSPSGALTILKQEQPAIFGTMHRGTLGKWKEVGERAFTATTLQSVSNRHTLLGTGRVGALTKHKDIVDAIKHAIISLRTSGLAVNVGIARSIMLAIIKEQKPEILSEHFECSERFVRDFLQSTLNYTIRKGTRAAAHLPADADDQCERTFYRLVYPMLWDNIPPELVVNVDQLGVYILPNGSMTYHTKGTKQVDIVGKEEKRAFTLLVASTPSGDFLPFQQVWGGRSKLSLPSKNATGFSEALDRGFHFAFAASESSQRSHFSTLKTMKEWVENILVPYIQGVIEANDLDQDQKAILFIDAYPVHTGKDFRVYIYDDHPNIILIFVPANCTGKFQPADVGLQRPIKHSLKQELFRWMAGVHKEQLANGVQAEDFKLTTSYPALRDASVAGIVKVYDWMKGPDGRDLIKKTWGRCTAKGFNLSAECLTSKEARTAMRKYLQEDPTLYQEIEKRCGKVFGVESEDHSDDLDTGEDDVDVPLEEVVKETLGEERMGTTYMLNGDSGHLENSGDMENVWAFDDNGNLWRETGAVPVEDDGDKEK